MKKSLKNSKSDLVKLSLTLFVIACVMAMLVSLVNNITSEEIEKRNAQKIADALKMVVTQADKFEEIDFAQTSILSEDGKDISIDGVWGAYTGDEQVGICVKVSPQGYGGKIETIVGINLDGEILETQIVSISETSGIGTKITENDFLSQFIGKKGKIIGTSSVSSSDEVALISGATKSSKAYLRGINAALVVANQCLEVIKGE